jgi:hypothetical protein
MKFKIGDKVIPKVFADYTKGIHFNPRMAELINIECEVTDILQTSKEMQVCRINNEWSWIEEALELVSQPQEYFYVGQTVYSPLFKNKDRSGKVIKIERGESYSILCEYNKKIECFTLDGKYIISDDFISLFQEPIQFPINKPIERFEEGEIVEVSNDGVSWGLYYYSKPSGILKTPYEVYINKDNGKLIDKAVYAKIRKTK